MRKALLVDFSFMVRVIVDSNATEDEIIATATPKLKEKLNNKEAGDNLVGFEDDLECPHGTFNQDYKYVVLRGIDDGNIFWTTNSEDNAYSAEGELWYEELFFTDSDNEAILKCRELNGGIDPNTTNEKETVIKELVSEFPIPCSQYMHLLKPEYILQTGINEDIPWDRYYFVKIIKRKF